MRKVFFLLVLAFLLILCPSAKKITVEDQLVDFDVFKKVLISKEGTLDLHVSADSIHAAMKKLELSLSRELSLIEQYKNYTSTLALIECGHTQIHPTRELFREWLAERNSLPIDYYLQGKKLYAGKLTSEDIALVNENKPKSERKKKIAEGSEIISIDSLTVPQMMQQISPLLSSDENGMDFKYFQASELFEFYRHLSQPFTKDSIEVSFLKGKDTIQLYFLTGTAPVYSINARIQNAATDYKATESDFGKFKIINSKYAYFRFKSFKVSAGKYYELFLERSFQKIRTRGLDKVIIDLRGNTGGVMQYSLMRYFAGKGIYLGRYVIQKPKSGKTDKHIRKWNMDYRRHKHASKIQKRLRAQQKFNNGEVRTREIDPEKVYQGQIVVITDEGTFSSAAILTCQLKTLCNAKIVGRPAGGSFYHGNAGTLRVKLPHSKFKLFVNPNTFYSHLPLAENPSVIKQPDYLIEPPYLEPKKMDNYYIQRAMKAFQ